MTVPRLERIKIENFRSINQGIDVPLNAPVVLIQGSNGAGKTSLLSAIELVLTGRVPSLQQADKDYATQLLHHGATNGYVQLSVSGLESIDEPLKLRIGQQGPIDNVRIDRDRAHFFSERCYLPQARLGRLLEIYQTAGDSTHSPLTLFVHDLLELDRLDALIDGLEPAHHITRIRKLVPEYKETEQAKQRLEERLSDANVDLSEAEARAESLIGQLTENLRQLHPDLASSRFATANRAALEGRLAEDAEGKALLQLADHERTLAAMRRRWERVAQMPGARERASLESRLQEAGAALDHWRNVEGKQLDATVEQVRTFFPELATSAATNPQQALEAARNRVEFDRAQVSSQVERASTDAKRLEELEHALAHATSRLNIVDREIVGVAAHVGDLAAALAALAPHIQGDECPVCGRDFAELNEGSLAVRVASEVVRLGEQSERLQVLERDRASLRAQIAKDVNERDAVKKRTLAEDSLFQLKQRLAKLEEAAAALVGLEEAASRGFDLIKRDADARRALADLRSHDNDANELRTEVKEFCSVLGVPPLDDAEQLDAALTRLVRRVEDATALARARTALSAEAHSLLTALVEAEAEIKERRANIERWNAELRVLADGLTRAARQRATARSVANAALRARTTVIGRVFNESLNKVWRDLFVRLAPNEPFVPRFKIPDTKGSRDPVNLETGHRSGGSGGTPGAMLSAGNLNTAALTLFLALHVSVEAQLPWLVLDDPVQSMDEVHVVQFAALLRTLSKEHSRQVLISVHDRQLFDYLKLELSPSFPGDHLVTVELSRSSSGKTRAVSTPVGYQPDTAITPVAA